MHPYIFSFVLLVCWPMTAFSINDEFLNLVVELDRDSYLVGQTINAKGRLTNVHNSELLINSRFRFPGPDIYLQIIDETERPILWLPAEPPSPLKEKDFIRLASGEEQNFELKDIQLYLQQQLQVGRYQLAAKYVNRSCIGSMPCWKGEITSNIVRFNIVKP